MNKWESYGKWRHPEIWWEIKLSQYFEKYKKDETSCNLKIIKIHNDKIEYCIDISSEKMFIEKNKLELLSIEPLNEEILYEHKIKVPFKSTFKYFSIWSFFENEKHLESISERIISNNPHWKMDILNDSQLLENINDVLCFHFERVYLVKTN